jgi:raffinose/stachyose/melibiose transport system substrate-binding protein
MMSTRFRGAGAIVAALACLALGACGSGGGASSGKTELTVLVDNGSVTAKAVKSVVEAFEKAHPDVDVKVNTRPQGSDGDNVVKTKLSTGDMEDVFWYNAGSLLQALDPEKTLTDLTNDPVALKDTDPQFLPVVTQNGKVYGAPQGTVQGGGILYNKDVYARLGLQVPKTWAEFAANNDKIKAAGVTPVLGTFKDTWTTQLFVLGDFHNVAVAQPSFAADYTANKVKYSTTPAALRGFEKTAEVAQKDWLNSGAGSATLSQGLP